MKINDIVMVGVETIAETLLLSSYQIIDDLLYIIL